MNVAVQLDGESDTPLASRASHPPFTTVIQRRYNPEGITAYNIVPGLIATILTMTMVMVTAVAMTRAPKAPRASAAQPKTPQLPGAETEEAPIAPRRVMVTRELPKGCTSNASA